MTDGAGGNGLVKPGRQWPGVGVGAVVLNDRRELLMVQRAGAHGAGTWSVPGGWVEMWEDPLDTARREVREETGVSVQPDKWWLNAEPIGWSDSQHRADGVHAITLWVICEYLSGEPTVTEPDKCPVVRWVHGDEVGDLPLFYPLSEWWPGPFLFRRSAPTGRGDGSTT